MVRGVAGERHQLVPPLAESDEQRQHHREHQQPMADGHLNDHRARHRTQHEAHGDRQHVHDHETLQRPRVEPQQHQVAHRDEAERRAQGEGRGHGARRERQGHADGQARRHVARGNRPPRLRRVQPIGLAIDDVVDQVHDARQRAEHHERLDRPHDGRRITEPTAEDQRREDDQVLRPLMWTQGDEQAGHKPPSRVRGTRLAARIYDIRSWPARHVARRGRARGGPPKRSSS